MLQGIDVDKLVKAEADELSKRLMDSVNHPAHYCKDNGLECIDVMIQVFGKVRTMAFCQLNAFKYIWRSEDKGGVEDLQKAQWYLNKYLELCNND